MKKLLFVLALFAICIFHSKAQSFNKRYDPNDLQVPNKLQLTNNALSIATNGSKILSTSNYKTATHTRFMVMDLDAASGAPGSLKLRENQTSIHRTSNSIVYAHNGSDHLSTGFYDDSGAPDINMNVTKRKNNGVVVWSINLGNSSNTEEGLLIIQDDPNADTYLVIGQSDYFGSISPYIAKIKDNGTSATVIWQNAYTSGSGLDETPTSVYRDVNGDFVVVGQTSGGQNDLFAFTLKANGVATGTWVLYDMGDVDETDPFVIRSASGAGGYVISYTLGDASTSAIGVMEISSSLTTVFWNNYYNQPNSDKNHAAAIYWNGSKYVVATGHHQTASNSGYPASLRLTVAGAVDAFYAHGTGANTYLRTQCMIPSGNGYYMKTMFANLEGYGIIATDLNGTNLTPCEDEPDMDMSPLTTYMEGYTPHEEDDLSVLTANETTVAVNGEHFKCDFVPFVGTFLPYSDEVSIEERWDAGSSKLEVVPTSVSSSEIKQTSIFPNPSEGSFTINFGEELPVWFEVTFLDGKQLLREQPNDQNVQIDLGQYGAGLYVLKVQYGNRQFVERLLVR